ncbi:MAG: TetR family transcriptional regulator [Actinomycetota bacterium]|nr:TetR family transcriptional regulator [Actinomycetota bacterium]
MRRSACTRRMRGGARASRTRLLDAALELLGRSGAASLTERATQDAAGLPHGSVRHHFGHRSAMVAALFDHLAEREGLPVQGDAADALEHLLGPGRTLTLARYELFIMAARDPTLRAPLVRARDRFVAAAAERVGAGAAPAVVAALDGLVLDALIRGERDPDQLRTAVAQILREA